MVKAEPLPLLEPGSTVNDLGESDIQISKLYHQLAKAHNELVEFIKSKMKR